MRSSRFHRPVTPSALAGEEGGFALILALFALVILTVLGITAVTISNVDLKIAHNVRRHEQVFYGAQAGLDRARWAAAELTPDDIQSMMTAFTLGQSVEWMDMGEGDPVETGGLALASYALSASYRQCASNVAGYSIQEDGDFDAVFIDWVSEAQNMDPAAGRMLSPASATTGAMVRMVDREMCGGAMF